MSEPSRSRPVSRPARVARQARRLAVALALGAATALGGCAGAARDDAAGSTGKGWRNPFAGGLRNPFRGPREDGFLALVREHCDALPLGDETIGQRLAADPVFQDQTSQLFRGDLSNDEYLNAVLANHPAADANIPAVGCVVTQLQSCIGARCDVAPPVGAGGGAGVQTGVQTGARTGAHTGAASGDEASAPDQPGDTPAGVDAVLAAPAEPSPPSAATPARAPASPSASPSPGDEDPPRPLP